VNKSFAEEEMTEEKEFTKGETSIVAEGSKHFNATLKKWRLKFHAKE